MSTRTSCGTLLRVMAALAFVAFAVTGRGPDPLHSRTSGRTRSATTTSSGTTTRPTTSSSTTTPRSSRISSGWPATPKARISTISSELKHDLAHKVPLILFQTSSEFQQQNVIPGAAQEGVGAFAEPIRQRIVMPMDEPPDLLYRLIVHELTHQFEFDIIPTSLDPPQHAAVGQRGPVRLHDRLLAAARPDDRARRGRRRHRAEDEQARGLRRLRQPAHDLQPWPRGLRVHRSRSGARKACGSTCSRCASR